MSFCSWFGGEKYKDHFDHGIYVCSECGYELFSSKAKYAHATPWPAFTSPIHKDSLAKHSESPGCLKVRCGKCNNGLGHEFLGDGPQEGMSRF